MRDRNGQEDTSERVYFEEDEKHVFHNPNDDSMIDINSNACKIAVNATGDCFSESDDYLKTYNERVCMVCCKYRALGTKDLEYKSNGPNLKPSTSPRCNTKNTFDVPEPPSIYDMNVVDDDNLSRRFTLGEKKSECDERPSSLKDRLVSNANFNFL